MAAREPDPATAGSGLLRRAGRAFGRRDAALTFAAFLAAVLGFSAVALLVALALGDPLLAGQVPGGGKSLLDAFWHLATAFVLVLPLRRRLAWVLAPALSLGIDVDHLFGSVLPYVVGRPAHDLFFAVLVTLFLYALEGRPAALLTAGAVTTHVAVDGGLFPFLSPATLALYPLPYPAEAALVAVAAVLFLLAFHEPRELLRKRLAVPAAVGVLVIAVALLFAPMILTFNTA